MWVRGVPYDEFAASYVNGAVIPVDGSATAVDVGTVPFDPRIEVRRPTRLGRVVTRPAQHPAQVDHHLLVDVLADRWFEDLALGPDLDGHLAVVVDIDRADGLQQRGHRVPLDVVAHRVLEDLPQRIPVAVVKVWRPWRGCHRCSLLGLTLCRGPGGRRGRGPHCLGTSWSSGSTGSGSTCSARRRRRSCGASGRPGSWCRSSSTRPRRPGPARAGRRSPPAPEWTGTASPPTT